MERSAQCDGPVRFGTFELDLRAGELRKSGRRVKLQEQPFQVLAALLERPGEVLTREELRQRLWADDTFVDFDRSLNTAVAKDREVLTQLKRTVYFLPALSVLDYCPASLPGHSITNQKLGLRAPRRLV